MLSYRAIEAMRGATRWFEALGEQFPPHVDVDVWTLWNATGPILEAVLKREGASIVCPVGKRFPRTA